MSETKPGRAWWKKKRWWVVGAFAVLLVCFETIPRFPFGPYTLYGDLTPEQRAAKPPFVVLSDERTHPFLYGARPLKQEWLTAVSKWPSVRSCLVKSERSKPKPDLRLMNWDAFRVSADAEVCLWRILSSLQDPELAVEWVKFHGMITKGLETRKKWVRPKAYNVYPPSVAEDETRRQIDTKVVQGVRNLSETRALFPSRGILSIGPNIISYAESLHLEWTAEGELMRVHWSHVVL